MEKGGLAWLLDVCAEHCHAEIMSHVAASNTEVVAKCQSMLEEKAWLGTPPHQRAYYPQEFTTPGTPLPLLCHDSKPCLLVAG